MTVAAAAPSARDKLEASSLRQDQLEGLGDVDTESLVLYVLGVLNLDVRDALEDVNIKRTIEGASTVTVTLIDPDTTILQRARFKEKVDVKIDGLWFRIVGVSKSRQQLTVTFEDREIAVLRTYNKFKIANRTNVTRAEFILSLIREVKEFHIKTYIPELHKKQPVETADTAPTTTSDGIPIITDAPATAGRDPGFPSPGDSHHHPDVSGPGRGLLVKGRPATATQLRNASVILNVGLRLGVRRKVLVAALMTAIQEASLNNPPDGDGTSIGAFQQTTGWGSAAERHDVATSARLFYLGAGPGMEGAVHFDKEDPLRPYWDLCQAVQRSAFPTRYAQWFTDANRLVTAYGVTGGDWEAAMSDQNASSPGETGLGGDYQFYRGKPPTNGQAPWQKEDSWACITRLAEEVQWRAFFVSGVFYYIDDDMLYKSKPTMVIHEQSDGINSIDFDYDTGKKNANITIDCTIKRWFAPPGSVVKIEQMGTINGRWLVQTVERSMFKQQGTITLKKPRPELKEPAEDAIDQQGGGASNVPTKPPVGGPVHNGAITLPLNTKPPTHSEFNVRDPEGAPDAMGVRWHAALDWFASAGSSVFSPVNGTIVEVRPADGDYSGQVFGGTIKVRDNVTGMIFVFRHVDPGQFRVGANVQEGTQIADVARWADNPSSSHAHIEIWKTESGGYTKENMIDPLVYFGLGSG